jgi:Diacylglycerol kinase catalytic domain
VIERVLLIVNSASGTGCAPSLPAELMRGLRESAGRLREIEVALVRNHPAARLAAASFLEASDAPAGVIAAGGGGTLRAAVEGVFDAGAACGTRIGALRMGSGNVIARRAGVARDPLTGIRQLGTAIRFGRTAIRPVIRCELGTADGGLDVRHAAVMCGLGQWGRTSGDLARWHRRLARGRAAAAALAGLERVNHLEYVAAAGGRLLEAAVRPSACERVEVAFRGGAERYRLLAGTVMTAPIAGIPFDPQVGPGEVAAGALFVPRGGRPRRFRLSPSETLRIRLIDRAAVEFFLDEDPEIAHREISLGVAGNLSFLEVAA